MQNTSPNTNLLAKMLISIVIVVLVAALAYLYFDIFVLKNNQQVINTEPNGQESADQARREQMNADPLVDIDLNEERKTEIQGDLRDKPAPTTSQPDDNDELRSSLTQ